MAHLEKSQPSLRILPRSDLDCDRQEFLIDRQARPPRTRGPRPRPCYGTSNPWPSSVTSCVPKALRQPSISWPPCCVASCFTSQNAATLLDCGRHGRGPPGRGPLGAGRPRSGRGPGACDHHGGDVVSCTPRVHGGRDAVPAYAGIAYEFLPQSPTGALWAPYSEPLAIQRGSLRAASISLPAIRATRSLLDSPSRKDCASSCSSWPQAG